MKEKQVRMIILQPGSLRNEVFFNHAVQNDFAVNHIPYQKEHKTLPQVLSQDKVKEFFYGIEDPKYFAIASTLYGSRLHLPEYLNLKIKDIDSSNMVITVRDEKGKKDRVTILSDKLLSALRTYYGKAKLSQ